MQQDELYRIRVNKEILQISPQDLVDLDARLLSNGVIHILEENTSYRARILDLEPDGRKIQLNINDVDYDIEIQRPIDQIIEKVNLSSSSSQRVLHTKAPMPGLVLEIKVQKGQQIKSGDSLLILEAMKMENLIKAASEGTVQRICVQQGDSVEKGQILIEIT